MDRVGGIHADDVAFVRVLGPIQVVSVSGCAVDLPSVSQRRLLARLAVVLGMNPQDVRDKVRLCDANTTTERL